jgi:hypothetical protein
MPQCCGSSTVSAQTLPPPIMAGHCVPPAGQEHAAGVPPHTSPCSQATLQLPQWAGSVFGFVQVAPHWTSPTGHVHWPFTQESPAGH